LAEEACDTKEDHGVTSVRGAASTERNREGDLTANAPADGSRMRRHFSNSPNRTLLPSVSPSSKRKDGKCVMAGSDDLQLPDNVKREMLTKLKVIQDRLKGGFPTSRELRLSLLELTELIDILIRRA